MKLFKLALFSMAVLLILPAGCASTAVVTTAVQAVTTTAATVKTTAVVVTTTAAPTSDAALCQQVIRDYWAAFNAFDLEKCMSYLDPAYAETRRAGVEGDLKQFEQGRGLGVRMVVGDFTGITTMDDGRLDIRVTMKITPARLSPDQYLLFYMVKIDGVWKIARQTSDPDRNPPRSAPGDFKAGNISVSRVDLSWTDTSTRETGYRVERASDRYFRNDLVSFSLPADSTTYSDTTVKAGTTYYYRVFAFNKVGDSTASDRLTVIIPAA
jgi:hypothetical protein